jgi:hypothetical protein
MGVGPPDRENAKKLQLSAEEWKKIEELARS